MVFGSLLAPTVSSYSLHNVTSLRKTLFQTNEYDVISRPMMDQSIPTIVHVSLLIYVIYDVDEVMQTLKVSASLRLSWRDEHLVWNPSDYDGIQTGVYPQNSVWKPDVSLKNSVDDFKTLGDQTLNVIVTSDGIVTWEPYQIFTSRCNFDITYFPFDRQACKMIFVTWGYMASEIRIWGPDTGPAAHLEDILHNPEWDLVGVRIQNLTEPRPMMIFDVHLKRKPRYVVHNIILPLIVLITLNDCVFLLPERSGEKTGYAVTVFLSFMVFATIVQATLPANSENVCYLSVFVTLQIVESAVITIVSICLVRIEGRRDSVPEWLSSLITCSTCMKCIKSVQRSSNITKGDGDRFPEQGKCDKTKVESVYKDECQYNGDGIGKERVEAEILDWGKVSLRLNWFFFALFVVFNISSICIFMTMLYGNTGGQLP
ncbi:hypothetical protein DPMN_056737 [Dreissena polymorpha]|uniref:Uncharacterized protein n=1 Tax=Dreissena polymorpha TaxID=45954 RepID=A0A9D4CS96_DREPO|nr:hypothetical protein DPMN_056737 [Dreissena polymorpha]